MLNHPVKFRAHLMASSSVEKVKQTTRSVEISSRNTNLNTKEHCGFPFILKILCTSATDFLFINVHSL